MHVVIVFLAVISFELVFLIVTVWVGLDEMLDKLKENKHG